MRVMTEKKLPTPDEIMALAADYWYGLDCVSGAVAEVRPVAEGEAVLDSARAALRTAITTLYEAATRADKHVHVPDPTFTYCLVCGFKPTDPAPRVPEVVAPPACKNCGRSLADHTNAEPFTCPYFESGVAGATEPTVADTLDAEWLDGLAADEPRSAPRSLPASPSDRCPNPECTSDQQNVRYNGCHDAWHGLAFNANALPASPSEPTDND